MTTTAAPLAHRAAAPATISPPTLDGYEFRAMSRGDAEIVHATVAAYEAADDVAARTAVEEITQPFDDPWWDAATDSLLAVARDSGAVAGRAIVTWRPGAARRVTVELVGGVHPKHRGRGVGSALLDWQLQRGRQVMAAATEQHLPGVMQIHVGDRQPGAAGFVQKHGFAATRWYYDMVRDLTTELPAAPALDAVHVVVLAEHLDLADEARVVRTTAFAEHFGSEPIDADTWRRRVIEHPFGRMDLSLLALDDAGSVVGLLTTGIYPQDWPDPHRSEGWIDLLGVLPTHRGRGIASALLVDAMRRYRGEGLVSAGLGVDAENVTGALRLYESLGFTQRRVEVAYELNI